jgi:hypothetical protein
VAIGAIGDLWEACEAAGWIAHFLVQFVESGGFAALAATVICQEQAETLTELLPDPSSFHANPSLK